MSIWNILISQIKLRKLLKKYFYSKTCIYHYLHMASGNYREYLKGEFVKIKKYFYVLRPIMACMWVEQSGTQPPMEFEVLIKSLNLSSALRVEIDQLLVRKRAGDELKEERQIQLLNEFLEEKIEHFTRYAKTLNLEASGDFEALDQLFRQILEVAWR